MIDRDVWGHIAVFVLVASVVWIGVVFVIAWRTKR